LTAKVTFLSLAIDQLSSEQVSCVSFNDDDFPAFPSKINLIFFALATANSEGGVVGI
jgi:hypothetical protein